MTTPPGFRAEHFEKAVKAGKHCFVEKPVAVDAPGVRRFLAAAIIVLDDATLLGAAICEPASEGEDGYFKTRGTKVAKDLHCC